MTTHLFTTSSRPVPVTNISAVEILIETHYCPVEPEFNTAQGTIAFNAKDAYNSFDVYRSESSIEPVTAEFLTELASHLHLESPWEIQCLETRAITVPAAWKWVVDLDGTVSQSTL